MSSFEGGNKDSIFLNLNTMLDVFSILITFLLMSFSADPISYDANPALELPESKTTIALDEIPTVVVTRSQVLINDKVVTTVMGGDVPEKDRAQGAIYPLYTELVKVAEANAKAAARTRQDKKKVGVITLEMDKDHPFRLMRRIMLTGQQADFVTFKLMVSKEIN